MLTTGDLTKCVITGILTLLLLAMSVTLLHGKGSWLIAGYNTLDKETKERYDSAALCKFMGKYLLSISLILPADLIAKIRNIRWLSLILGLYLLISAVYVVIYANTGNRFKK